MVKPKSAFLKHEAAAGRDLRDKTVLTLIEPAQGAFVSLATSAFVRQSS